MTSRDEEEASPKTFGMRSSPNPIKFKINCVECGTERLLNWTQFGVRKIRRCSAECAFKARKGRLFSEEHKRKIGLAQKGRIQKPFSEETKRRMSEARRGIYPLAHLSHERRLLIYRRKSDAQRGVAKPNRRGPNNPMWRGGVSAERHAAMGRAEYKNWRRAVFSRDNHICQLCGIHGGYVEADHIKSWASCPELRYEISNGRTLCGPCHKKTPSYGKKLSTKKLCVGSNLFQGNYR